MHHHDAGRKLAQLALRVEPVAEPALGRAEPLIFCRLRDRSGRTWDRLVQAHEAVDLKAAFEHGRLLLPRGIQLPAELLTSPPVDFRLFTDGERRLVAELMGSWTAGENVHLFGWTVFEGRAERDSLERIGACFVEPASRGRGQRRADRRRRRRNA